MKKIFVLFSLATIAAAQDGTQTFLIGRAAFGARPYEYAEAFQVRGKWILPDVGVISFRSPGQYRELFTGGGRIFRPHKRVTLIQELYVTQATGPQAQAAFYLQPWTYLSLAIAKTVASEVVYFPYLPMNSSAHFQQVLEHWKMLEKEWGRWKLGFGYSGYQFGSNDWQHKPFVSATIKTGRAGEIELWFQRVPGNHPQMQIRYQKIFQK